MPYPWRKINGPHFKGQIQLKRNVDMNRVVVTNDGILFGVDVMLKLALLDDDIVRVSVTDGSSEIPVLDAHTNGWRSYVEDSVRLIEPYTLGIDLEGRPEFGGFSFYGKLRRFGEAIKLNANLLPTYAPRMRFDADLSVIGWREPWKGNPWNE